MKFTWFDKLCIYSLTCPPLLRPGTVQQWRRQVSDPPLRYQLIRNMLNLQYTWMLFNASENSMIFTSIVIARKTYQASFNRLFCEAASECIDISCSARNFSSQSILKVKKGNNANSKAVRWVERVVWNDYNEGLQVSWVSRFLVVQIKPNILCTVRPNWGKIEPGLL